MMHRFSFALPLSLLVGLTGCSEVEQQAARDGASSSLARVLGIASVDECPNGGVELEYGIDTNQNGQLDDSEVTGSYSVCHGEAGADGKPCVSAPTDEGGYEITCPNQDPIAIEAGPQGEPGLPGEPGEKGDKGNQGEPGEPGPEGEPGPDGSTALVATAPEPPGETCKDGGVRIDSGLDLDASGALEAPEITGTSYVCNGAAGEAGPTGDTGSKGETGETGLQGDKGDIGPKGDPGETGAKGDIGPKGDPGETGAKGDVGPKGDPGETGAKGDAGPKGDPGENGAKGEKGEIGPKGEPGAKGADGISVVSATVNDEGKLVIKLSNGAEAVSEISLIGPEGPQGDKGEAGPKGDPGPPGVKGDTGATGAKGAKGDTGAPGAKGAKGDMGAQGSPGAKGATGATGPPGPAGGTSAGSIAGYCNKNAQPCYSQSPKYPGICNGNWCGCAGGYSGLTVGAYLLCVKN